MDEETCPSKTHRKEWNEMQHIHLTRCNNHFYVDIFKAENETFEN